MGDYHSILPSISTMDQAEQQSLQPPRNPLAVSSLTSPSPPLEKKNWSQQQSPAPSRSQPFSCPSLNETLHSHGAAAPSQTPHFRLQMRQEPIRGLAVGTDELAFKNARVTPLDPPPICELVPEQSSDIRYISVPELSVQACLVYSESPFESVATSSKVKDPMVSGLQECGFIAPVTARHEECLFVFAELGIRIAGDFRIRFDLIDRVGFHFRRLASIYTSTFTVAADKRTYPGLSPSTELIHSLVRRGLKLRIIKSQNGKIRKRKKLERNHVSDDGSSSGPSQTPLPFPASEQHSGHHTTTTTYQQSSDRQYPLHEQGRHHQQQRQDHHQYNHTQQQQYTPLHQQQLSPHGSPWPSSHLHRPHSHPSVYSQSSSSVHLNPSPTSSNSPFYYAPPFHSSTNRATYQDDQMDSKRVTTSAAPSYGWPRQKLPIPFPPTDSSFKRPVLHVNLSTPSLSSSTGSSSKTSAESATSIASTPDEDYPLKRLHPSIYASQPTSRPIPSYNYREGSSSSSSGREEEALRNRSFLPAALLHHKTSNSHSTLRRPTLPPLSSIDTSPPRRPPNPTW